ncbi:MAG TPA: malonyl CoA-acyl carrier protein transacylase, partial [Nitrospira sp.]|nr:malonyl CoA-acyl carrier protein transacylase [Nitrospira sp.]
LPSSVLWEDTVQAMGNMGVTTFVEVGPGTVLTGLIKRILPGVTLLNVSDPKSLETTLNAMS